MQKFAPETITKQYHWRYAVKKFDATKKISEEHLQFLLETANLAPSSYGLQPYKILVIDAKAIREQLKKASFDQTQVVDASHFIVFTTLRKVTEKEVHDFITNISKIRGIPVSELKGYQGMIVGDLIKGPRSAQSQAWCQRQAYIAMGSLLMNAALIEIDTCAMEGLNSVEYDKILALDSTEYSTVAAVAIGYRSNEDRTQSMKKVRKNQNDFIQRI